jgi:hemolysin activation/secretion protein
MRFLAPIAIIAAAALFVATAARAFDLPEGVNAGIGFENGGHDTAGPHKALSYIQFTNRLGFGETLKISSAHSSDFGELNTIMADLNVPLGERWFVSTNTSYSDTHPGGTTGKVFDEKTHNVSFGGTLNRYVFSTDTLTGIVTGGFDVANVRTRKESVLMPPVMGLGIPFIPDEAYRQRTRDLIARIALQYDPSDDLGIFGAFTVSQGVDWDDPEHFRLDVVDTPTVLGLSARLTQNLPHTLQLVIRGEGQWTQDRLNQQKMFTLGGADFATAYRSGERIGDIGAGYHLELNKLGLVSVPAMGDLYYKPFVFVDGGIVRNNDPLPSETRGYRMEASVGAGISFEATNGLHAGVQVAWPLTGGSVFEGGHEEARFLFTVGFKK